MKGGRTNDTMKRERGIPPVVERYHTFCNVNHLADTKAMQVRSIREGNVHLLFNIQRDVIIYCSTFKLLYDHLLNKYFKAVSVDSGSCM